MRTAALRASAQNTASLGDPTGQLQAGLGDPTGQLQAQKSPQ